MILINLVSGRNPWKKANMQDAAFASFVKQPRKFFRTTLAGISKSLDRILIRIFCLDPAKRITLFELRSMILSCRSFTTTGIPVRTKSIIQPLTNQEITCTKSFESTVMAYIGDYIDDEQCFKKKSCSYTSSINEDPPTPRNGSPILNPIKQQHYFYEQNLLKK